MRGEHRRIELSPLRPLELRAEPQHVTAAFLLLRPHDRPHSHRLEHMF